MGPAPADVLRHRPRVVSGGLEPAYEVGGDTFDYALNGTDGPARHRLRRARAAGRRAGQRRDQCLPACPPQRSELPDIAAAIDQAIATQLGASQFATAVLARLDIETGRLRWINAGHPAPLIVRGGSLVRTPSCPPNRPLGLQEAGHRLRDATGARGPAGPLHRRHHRGPLPARASSSASSGWPTSSAPPPPPASRPGDGPPADAARPRHQADQLQDDASIVVLEWRAGTERILQI